MTADASRRAPGSRPGPAPPDAAGRAGRALALGLWALLAAVASLQMPLWGDDWCLLGASGLGGALDATWAMYQGWTGRLAPMLLVHLVLGPGQSIPLPWFEALNGLVFAALLLLVVRLAGRAAGHPVLGQGSGGRGFAAGFATYALAGLLIWWLPRSIAETALWRTGTLIYLWGMAAELFVLDRALALFGAPAGRAIRGAGGARTALLAGFALAAATFLEPLSLLVSGALLLLAGLAWRRGGAGRGALTALALAHLAGTAALLAAPGNFARASGMPGMALGHRLEGWLGFVGSVFDPYWIAAALLLALAWLAPRLAFPRLALPSLALPFPGLALMRLIPLPRLASPGHPGALAARGGSPGRVVAAPGARRGGPRIASAIAPALPFLLAALAYLLLLLGLPRETLAGRLSFPASVLLVGAVVALLLARPPASGRGARGLALALGLLLLPTHAAVVTRDLEAIAAHQRDWVAAAEAHQAADPEAELVLPLLLSARGKTWMARKHRFFVGITRDPDHWANRCYARALGLPAIRGA